MRVSSLGVARPAYYDRNATFYVQGDTNTYAPHGTTTRWTATIAAGKKAVVEGGVCLLWQATAPTTAGTRLAIIRATSGASTADLAVVGSLDGTIGKMYSDKPGYGATIYAGETLSGITSDPSIGGTVLFEVAIKGTQFDA